MDKLKGLKILVVDDEELLRDIISELFEIEGAQTQKADSGLKAIEMYKKNKYDFVFSDVRMANGTGIDLAKGLFKINPKAVLFLCTGYSDVGRDELLNLGVREVFSKPFDAEELIQRISELMLTNES